MGLCVAERVAKPPGDRVGGKASRRRAATRGLAGGGDTGMPDAFSPKGGL